LVDDIFIANHLALGCYGNPHINLHNSLLKLCH
jgi:hypothetical protein